MGEILSVIIGSVIGALVGIYISERLIRFTEKMQYKSKAKKHRKQGKQTCTCCQSGITKEMLDKTETVMHDINEGFVGIYRCHFCGADNLVKLVKNKWIIPR